MTKQFSNYSDLLTFTRASKGHALRPVSYGTELVVNGTFDSTDISDWVIASSSATVAHDTGGDGGRIAVTTTGSAGNGRVGQDLGQLTAGKAYRVFVDFDKGTANAVYLRIAQNAAGGTTVKQVIGSGTSGTIEYTFVPASTAVYYVVLVGGNTTGHVAYFDNVSVKEVTFDQPDGTLTLFEHPEDIPRVEYDADGNRLGLLVEEQRVNLILNSSDFSVGSWTKSGSSISAATNITAPDGTTNSFKLIESSSTAVHRVEGASAAGGTTSTMSCFMKKAERKWGNINFSGLGGGNVWFDLENGVLGTVGASVTARIEDYGNGWYRCSVTGTPTSSAPTDIKVANADNTTSYTGDGTSGIYVFGAQTEAGSFPTSYIKTTGSTATRSADIASIPVADFGYNQSEGTVVVEAKTFSNAEANHGDFALTDSGTSPDLSSGSRTGSSVAGSYSTWYKTAGTTQANLVRTSAVEDNVFYKAGFCYKANDFAQSVDGGSILSDSSGTVPSRNSVVLIGDNYYGKLNGHIKSIKYYPRRLTNAQLQEITT